MAGISSSLLTLDFLSPIFFCGQRTAELTGVPPALAVNATFCWLESDILLRNVEKTVLAILSKTWSVVPNIKQSTYKAEA